MQAVTIFGICPYIPLLYCCKVPQIERPASLEKCEHPFLLSSRVVYEKKMRGKKSLYIRLLTEMDEIHKKTGFIIGFFFFSFLIDTLYFQGKMMFCYYFSFLEKEKELKRRFFFCVCFGDVQCDM